MGAAGSRSAFLHGGNAEVEQLGDFRSAVAAGQENVLRLHVAMDDAFGVRLAQSLRNAAGDGQSALNR